jgi:hypothetical protein
MTAQKAPPDAYAQALAMRLDGKSYREIGQALGVTRQRVQALIAPPTKTEDIVVARAGGRCEACQAPAGRSGHIHHRQAKGMTPDTYNAEPNLALLCPSCHPKAHRDPEVYARRQRRYMPEAVAERKTLKGYRTGAMRLGIPVEEYRHHREHGELWCNFHRTWESAKFFGLVRGRPATRCREGNREAVRQTQTAAYRRDYYRRNSKRLNAYRAEWERRRRAVAEAAS